MTSLTKIYEDRVKRGDLQRDSAQEAVLGLFDTVAKTLQKPVKKGLRGLFGKSVEPAKGLYLFGGVGRGKSMLMDLFYDHSEEPRKRRVHFHAFMLEIHKNIHEWRYMGAKARHPSCGAKHGGWDYLSGF